MVVGESAVGVEGADGGASGGEDEEVGRVEQRGGEE